MYIIVSRRKTLHHTRMQPCLLKVPPSKQKEKENQEKKKKTKTPKMIFLSPWILLGSSCEFPVDKLNEAVSTVSLFQDFLQSLLISKISFLPRSLLCHPDIFRREVQGSGGGYDCGGEEEERTKEHSWWTGMPWPRPWESRPPPTARPLLVEDLVMQCV